MGLPTIDIEFTTKAKTAVTRSQNGIVALILADNTKEDTTYTYTTADDVVKSHWTTANLEYINQAFLGKPKRVIVERVSTTDTNYDDAKTRLGNKKWNYLAIPDIAEDDVQDFADWIAAKRAAKSTYKAVLPHCAANNEGIINFATEGIKVGTKTYTAAQYCGRIAGLLAGLSLNISSTYYVLSEVEGITESLTPDANIDAGQFILINDGEKIKVGRGVNSLVTLSDGKTEDMKKIKIIEGIDLMRDDIRTTFEERYIGKANSYDNKLLFISAVNQYFTQLAQEGVLDENETNAAEIDIDAQRAFLAGSYDVSEKTDDEIKTAKTGSWVFILSKVAFMDAMEDLKFSVTMG